MRKTIKSLEAQLLASDKLLAIANTTTDCERRLKRLAIDSMHLRGRIIDILMSSGMVDPEDVKNANNLAEKARTKTPLDYGNTRSKLWHG